MTQPQMKQCPRCKCHIEASLRMCSCGHDFFPQPVPVSTRTEIQNTPVLNTATGCVAGSTMGVLLILGGSLVSLTGIGAIIGIPMIIAGIGCFVAGPIAGAKMKVVDGVCPYCNGKVQTFATIRALDCPECKQRILFRDGLFTRINQ